MDEPMKDASSISYDIDGTTVFKVKAKNRFELLDALKDGGKCKKVQAQNGQGSRF